MNQCSKNLHFELKKSARNIKLKSAEKDLTEALCATANREFESRLLRSGEDPAVYKWELEQALEKADLSLDKPIKEMLLTRQLLKGLRNKMKLLGYMPLYARIATNRRQYTFHVRCWIVLQ